MKQHCIRAQVTYPNGLRYYCIFHFSGKIKPWERAMMLPDGLKLIDELGVNENLSDNAMEDIVEFVRKYVYCGRKGEDLVITKMRMY